MKADRWKIVTIGTYLGIALLLSLLVTGAGIAQDRPDFISMVQEMESEKSDLTNPAGVVFSLRANVFHVVESRGNNNISPDGLVIKNISVFGHNAGTTPININIEDPINVAMDNNNGRLLVYQSTTQQLIEISEGPSGDLDLNSQTVHEVSYLGLVDPQGMTFDPIHGYLYFLDAVGPRLVGINLQPDGSPISATTDVVNLSSVGNTGLRGVAFDPTSGNFQVVSPSEQRLYEFTNSGEVVGIRDLSEFNLSSPQGIIFAPSADQTDDPMVSNLFLADKGAPVNSPTDRISNDNSVAAGKPGKLVELSLAQPVEQINADFPAALVKTTNTSAYSPPSPDPAGLTYLSSSNTLLISDPDVEETKLGITHFQGANLWEVTLAGTVVRTANISAIPYNTPSPVPMTNEPTGVAWNPGNGHYYISDDNSQAVFDLNPGIDGLIGTADDSWTSFPTTLENGDPEGIAYDSWHDRLYVIDGTNLEVYVYTLSGTFVNQFDVGDLTALDTESIEFNRISGTFFILSNWEVKKIFEISVDTTPVPPTNFTTTLINTIDISAANPVDPAGLTYAPASDGSEPKHFYIVDRGVDNDFDPNENDGKLYEMTAPTASLPVNNPPAVNAGLDQSVTIATGASLSGTATDDGNPNPPATVTTLWSKVSGPGTVIFADPAALITTASFSASGTYALRLTAYDGEFYTYDEININVISLAGSSILEKRVLTSSDDAEESNTGTIDLISPSLDMIWPDQTIGIRFIGVNLPKNALINNAYIQFETQKLGSTATSLTIWGEAQDNPGTFTATSQDVSSRLRTATSAVWTPPSWTVLYQAGVDQRTSNISTILEDLISRPGWSSGNSMVFIIGGTGLRTAWSYDGLRSGAPRLHIEYTISANQVPVAVDDTYTTPEDTQLSRNANLGVLKNDTDADHDPLTAFKYTDPANGTLSFNPNGSFVYTPALNFNGADSFTYYANDDQFNSNIATVTITVTPVNDTPTDIALSANTVVENLPINTVVGTLSTTDLDVGDTFSYSLVSGAGSTDNASFNISGSSLRTSAVFDYEIKNSYSIRVRSTDAGSLFFEKVFTIVVINVNDAPTDIALSANTVAENLVINTVVGTLSTSDADPGDTFTYSLVSGAGSTDNASFNISGNSLRTSAVFNYETKNSYSIRVRTTDAGSLYFEKVFTILVTNVNEVPTDIALSANTVAENLVINTVVGTLSTTDPDVGDTFNYTLVSGAGSTDNASFNISGSSLRTSAVFDYETKNSYSIRVRSTDTGSLYFEKAFTILVTNVNDAPVAVDEAYSIAEDTTLIVVAPGVLGNDTDPENDPLTAILNVGPAHGELTLNANGSFVYTPDPNYFGTDSFTYHARDAALNSNIATVTITIVDKLEVFYLPVINR